MQYRQLGTILTQLVIAWPLAQPGITHALIGGRTAAQVLDNARGGELRLEPANVQRMKNDVMALGEPA